VADRLITVSFGNGTNFADITRVKELTWDQLVALLTTKVPETEDKSTRGWFTPASFNDEWRHGANFKQRFCLTFDYDKVTPFDVDLLQEAYEKVTHVEYTTHSHTESKPRWRFVFPLSRPCSADEFQAVSRKVAMWAGPTGIELTAGESHKTAQMMFLPCLRPGEKMQHRLVDHHSHAASVIDVDAVLASYENWNDRTQWPHRKDGDDGDHREKSEDPRTKPGIIGAFCRTYSISAAIEKFELPYVRAATEGRWTYTKGSRPEGAISYDDDTKLHSHHDTDPARGQHNAFDLVRLHRFASLDDALDMEGEPVPITERPSFRAMVALAQESDIAAESAAELFEDLGAAPVQAKDPAAPVEGPALEIPFSASRAVESALDRVLDALRLAGPDLGLVVFGNRLVWAVESNSRKGFDDRPVTALELRGCTGGNLPAIWHGRIRFVRKQKSKDGDFVNIRVDCPPALASAAVTRTDRLQDIAVDRIALTPIYADGALYAQRGYSKAHKAWVLAPTGVVVSGTSKEDARNALTRLDDWISEFPFDTTEDRDVALAALLTASMRASLDHAPGFVVSKPDYGSGASTLCDLINVVLSGEPAAVTTAGLGKQELIKNIDAAQVAGLASIVIDNLPDGSALDSEELAQVLVSASRKVRYLGRSEVTSVPCTQMVLLNGNNVGVKGNLARRFLPIRLDAHCEAPHRRQYKRPQVIFDAQRERAAILSAAYTIIAAHDVAQDKPKIAPLNSFNAWTDTVASALVWLGHSNPCDALKKLEQQDEVRNELVDVMNAWAALFGDKAVSVREVLEDSFDAAETEKRRALKETLQDFAADQRNGHSISNKRLGKWLLAVKGRVIGGRAFEEAGISGGYKRWRLRSDTEKDTSWLEG